VDVLARDVIDVPVAELDVAAGAGVLDADRRVIAGEIGGIGVIWPAGVAIVADGEEVRPGSGLPNWAPSVSSTLTPSLIVACDSSSAMHTSALLRMRAIFIV